MGGSLEFSEIENIYKLYPEYQNIQVFIETGTYKGETTRLASKYFNKVYTMEIKKELYDESKKIGKEQNCANITYFLGDSVEILKVLIPMVKESSIYFLDAHISGMDSGFNGKQCVPLIEELNIIVKNLEHPSIFIIDDLRFFVNTQKPWDWSHISIETIKKLFEDNKIEILADYSSNDRYIILTK